MAKDYSLENAQGQVRLWPTVVPDSKPRRRTKTWFDKLLDLFGLQRKVK